MSHCRDTSQGVIIFRNGRPSLVLGDDHSHMGGSDDMKSGVVIVEIVVICRLHIYVSGIGHGYVHCGINYCTLHLFITV